MKVFKAKWSVSGRFAYYEEHCCIIVAQSKGDALGRALMHLNNTQAEHWDIEEIDATFAAVHDVSEHSVN